MSGTILSKSLKFFIIPLIILNLLFWLFGESLGILNLVILLIPTFVLPIYLLFQNSKTKNKAKLLLNLPLMIILNLLAILLNYLFWGITTGLLLYPDGETIAVAYNQVIISVGILIIGTIINYLFKLTKK